MALDGCTGGAPLLTIYGGKITTYRRLAEHALDRLQPVVSAGPAWTRDAHLPGGEFPHDGFETLVARTRRSRPFLSETLARRLLRAYGTRVDRVLGPARGMQDLGPCLGADLHAAEVRYLMEREWAQTEDDVLWRRSKLGLRFSPADRERLARFMAAAIGAGVGPDALTRESRPSVASIGIGGAFGLFSPPSSCARPALPSLRAGASLFAEMSDTVELLRTDASPRRTRGWQACGIPPHGSGISLIASALGTPAPLLPPTLRIIVCRYRAIAGVRV